MILSAILAASMMHPWAQGALPAKPLPVSASKEGTQETSAPTQEDPEDRGKRSREWWEQLSPEEQAEMRKRMEAMRAMPEASRESMEKRRQVVEEEKAFVIEHLSPEERVAYEAMSDRERRRFLGPKVHQRLRERGENLKARFPKVGPDREAFEEARRPQVEEGIAQALEEGWIGEATAAWLQRAPLHQSMQVLMEVQKWQFLDRADRRGFWEEHDLDEQAQRHLSGMPAHDFFREIREIQDGGPGPQGRKGRGVREGREWGRGRPGGPGFEGGERPGSHGKEGRRGQGPPHPPREGRPHPSPPEGGPPASEDEPH